jgi:ATP-dependent DNA ligase
MPFQKIDPMLAKIGSQKDFSKKQYVWEPKFDGTRAIVTVPDARRHALSEAAASEREDFLRISCSS